MPRIRTIKPEFWQDEKLVGLSDATRLIFLGLVSLADDAGRLLDKPVKIEADLFDGEADRRHDVVEALATLSRIGVIRRGLTASGQRIIEITNWKRHQRVDHPNLAAAFPQIVTLQNVSDIREAFANDSRGVRDPLAHHTNDQYQRPVPTTNDQGPASSEQLRASDLLHCRLLTAAANRAIAERFGEQPAPLVATNGTTHSALQKLEAEAVPVEFAASAIEDIGRHGKFAAPPRSLGYFVPGIIDRWRAELAYRDATSMIPAATSGDGGSGKDPMYFTAIRYAREGDAEWQTYCQDKGITWEAA